jgi:hypothetical protein
MGSRFRVQGFNFRLDPAGIYPPLEGGSFDRNRSYNIVNSCEA